MMGCYYLPAQRLVVGTKDPDVIARLYCEYVKRLDPALEPGRYDGSTVFTPSDAPVTTVLTVTVGGANVVYRAPFTGV